MLRHRRARVNGAAPKSAPSARDGRPVLLSDDELAMVLAACRRYRQSIPVYLASCQAELQLLKAVIRKLS